MSKKVVAKPLGVRAYEAWMKFYLQFTALLGLHIIAFFYDGQWIYAAVAADLMILGIKLNGWRNGVNK